MDALDRRLNPLFSWPIFRNSGKDYLRRRADGAVEQRAAVLGGDEGAAARRAGEVPALRLGAVSTAGQCQRLDEVACSEPASQRSARRRPTHGTHVLLYAGLTGLFTQRCNCCLSPTLAKLLFFFLNLLCALVSPFFVSSLNTPCRFCEKSSSTR